MLPIWDPPPRYPQYNEFTEAMIKIVKQTMKKKTEWSKEEPHHAMLACRITRRGPGKLSPADTMTQHKFRALLLIKQHLSTQLTTRKEITLQQNKQQAKNYNCTSQQLWELQQYQPVWVYIDSGQQIMQKAAVIGTPKEKVPRAY